MSRIAVIVWFVLVTVLTVAVIADDADPISPPEPAIELVAAPAGVIAYPEPDPVPVEVPAEPEPVPQAPVPAPAPRAAAPQSTPGECDGEAWVLPTSIVWRESRCDFGAVNVGGCGGNGCLGAYQFDARHFSGWANGQAACGDLDWTIPADQHECARRLSADGTNLAPWGG